MKLQALLVALIVTLCVLYSAWRLAPAGLRRSALGSLARVPGLMRVRVIAAWHARAQGQVEAGCGGCAATSASLRKRTPGALPRS
jgi:hypothetical protein